MLLDEIIDHAKVINSDFDGVPAIDSEILWKEFEQNILFPQIAPNLTAEEHQQLLGLSVKGIYDFLNNHDPITLSWENFYRAYEMQAFELYERVQLAPGYAEILERIKQKDKIINIVSNSPEKWIRHALKKWKIEHYFTHVITIDHPELRGIGKPNPEIYKMALKKSNCAPEYGIAIEDSSNGMRAAYGAGQTVIAFDNGHNSAIIKNLNPQKAHFILKSFAEKILQPVK